MRIEIIERSTRNRSSALLSRAFALRHRVFVEQRGWEFLRQSDGLDRDRHDAGAATHILAIAGDSESAQVLGHVRVIPGGYLAVAHADPGRVRQAAGDSEIYGLSRFCVMPETTGPISRKAVSARLFIAALDYVVAHGSYTLLFDTDPSILFLLRVLGFSLEDVGEPAPIAGRVMQPVVLRLDASVLSSLSLKLTTWGHEHNPDLRRMPIASAAHTQGG